VHKISEDGLRGAITGHSVEGDNIVEKKGSVKGE